MSELETLRRILNAVVDNAGGYDHSLLLAGASAVRGLGGEHNERLADRMARLDRLGRAALRGEPVSEDEL